MKAEVNNAYGVIDYVNENLISTNSLLTSYSSIQHTTSDNAIKIEIENGVILLIDAEIKFKK